MEVGAGQGLTSPGRTMGIIKTSTQDSPPLFHLNLPLNLHHGQSVLQPGDLSALLVLALHSADQLQLVGVVDQHHLHRPHLGLRQGLAT